MIPSYYFMIILKECEIMTDGPILPDMMNGKSTSMTLFHIECVCKSGFHRTSQATKQQPSIITSAVAARARFAVIREVHCDTAVLHVFLFIIIITIIIIITELCKKRLTKYVKEYMFG